MSKPSDELQFWRLAKSQGKYRLLFSVALSTYANLGSIVFSVFQLQIGNKVKKEKEEANAVLDNKDMLLN